MRLLFREVFQQRVDTDKDVDTRPSRERVGRREESRCRPVEEPHLINQNPLTNTLTREGRPEERRESP